MNLEKRLGKLIVCGIFILMVLPFVLAEDNLVASISKPKMVLYKNITGGETLKFQNSVVVNNKNDFNILVTIKPIGIWKDKVKISEPSFILESDKRKEVFYDVVIKEKGYYKGDILVTFEEEGSDKMLSIVQDITVIVSDENGNVEDKKNSIFTKIVLGFFSIILLVLLIGLYKIGRKKRK